MNGRISKVLTVAATLFLAALLILAIPSFSDPEFEFVNNSSEAVSVVAAWRNNEREIGGVQPGTSHQFRVNDEAAMKFKIRYASGREIESEPVYFTSGTKVIATISNNSIEVRYDSGT